MERSESQRRRPKNKPDLRLRAWVAKLGFAMLIPAYVQW